jgi:hypothetical protein
MGAGMATLDWFWAVLGLDPSLPLPTVTRVWLQTLRDERIANLRIAGARTADFVRVNLAYAEAKKYIVD